jgi:positive regulator of sigma E activity
MDLVTILQILAGVVCGFLMILFFNRNKSNPTVWPRIFGIGGAVFMFIVSMIGSILSRPKSEYLDYTIASLAWSLVIGIMGYYGGYEIARRLKKTK